MLREFINVQSSHPPLPARPRTVPASFTLLELMVVIAILGVFVGFLLPAVLRVREVSNRTRCANNLKHIGMAMLNHHSLYRHYPSGGWGYLWVGDPDRPANQTQPGGWVYNILPFVEQGPLHHLGAGGTFAQRKAAAAHMIQTPLSLMNCPSRRSATLYPNSSDYYNSEPVSWVARSDYAACAGEQARVQNGAGPVSLMEGLNSTFWMQSAYSVDEFTGVIYQRSVITLTDLTRGASNTYLVGEKYLNPNAYTTGTDDGDNQNMYVGMDNDISRSTLSPPLQDQAGHVNTSSFGSAHPSGVNMLYCDGSFRLVSYAVDPQVFRAAGSRR